MATLTEVFPCFFLSCKTNARVKPAKSGLLIFLLFHVLFVLCPSLYCLCVYVYCTTATGCLPNCSYIYHIVYNKPHKYITNLHTYFQNNIVYFIPRNKICLYICISHSKPIGHVMHHQFNIQQLYALPKLYLCVLYLSENKQRLLPLRA
jgi:hypothetical protein